ncbi:aromatic amino acid transaminase [Sphingomonas sp. LB2R24]|uniref:aromatic amino acid transaminase n=1 Tax=Sphingomonas sorbitolis TaxID=3096165 RepID=UPI002FC7723B
MTLLDNLPVIGADGPLAATKAFEADLRPFKADLGIGVYKDEAGATPVMRAVKAAEARLVRDQRSKSYLGLDGDQQFADEVGKLAISRSDLLERSTFMQTPGGTGALRLAMELIAARSPTRRIIVGVPGWVNYGPICREVGLDVVGVDTFDLASQRFESEGLLAAIETAKPGDAVLLQVSCHNPHGADPTPAQWHAIATAVAERGVLPVLDMAYQGFGSSLEDDARPIEWMLERSPEALIAVTCSKNFSLYRERTGALGIVGEQRSHVMGARSLALSKARICWSMPPDHGAAVVRTILQDDLLRTDWGLELEWMRQRVNDMRAALSARLDASRYDFSTHKGMFALLPLKRPSIERLRVEDGIYVSPDGRINVAGLNGENAARVLDALIREIGKSRD